MIAMLENKYRNEYFALIPWYVIYGELSATAHIVHDDQIVSPTQLQYLLKQELLVLALCG